MKTPLPAGDVLLLVLIFLGRLGSRGRLVFPHYPHSSSLDCNSGEGRLRQESEDSVIFTKYKDKQETDILEERRKRDREGPILEYLQPP